MEEEEEEEEEDEEEEEEAGRPATCMNRPPSKPPLGEDCRRRWRSWQQSCA